MPNLTYAPISPRRNEGVPLLRSAFAAVRPEVGSQDDGDFDDLFGQDDVDEPGAAMDGHDTQLSENKPATVQLFTAWARRANTQSPSGIL